MLIIWKTSKQIVCPCLITSMYEYVHDIEIHTDVLLHMRHCGPKFLQKNCCKCKFMYINLTYIYIRMFCLAILMMFADAAIVSLLFTLRHSLYICKSSQLRGTVTVPPLYSVNKKRVVLEAICPTLCRLLCSPSTTVRHCRRLYYFPALLD